MAAHIATVVIVEPASLTILVMLASRTSLLVRALDGDSDISIVCGTAVQRIKVASISAHFLAPKINSY